MQQLREDRIRHNEVTREGWTLLHATSWDVYRDPRGLVQEAAGALGIPVPVRARRLRPDDHGPQVSRARRVPSPGP